MTKTRANERTFQGIFISTINKILPDKKEIKFRTITQEEQVGVGQSRFADCKLYSSINTNKIVSFELKNINWDATDETLVRDAAMKANDKGYEYFVTGTPRQLALYKTHEPGVPLLDRKLKIYTLSNIKHHDDVLQPSYEKLITQKLIFFLQELSDILHDVKVVRWDSIDKYFVNKLSAYILEASADMLWPMYDKISKSKALKKNLREYLKNQEIFNVTLNFDIDDVYKLCQLSNYLLYLKVIFYSYLQRDVKELGLKPLQIPEDKDLLNKTLRARFDDVLKHDYELIFEESILDDFEFSTAYIPYLKKER